MSSRPRTRSMLSFTRTRHRRSSSSSHPKVDNLVETPEEKASHRVTSKADPSKAINEAQPIVRAFEKPTIESIRAIQHKDIHGNLISICNTMKKSRRLERPLDTIRSFEAAIDGSYDRRPMSRAEMFDANGAQSKRNSYYQGLRPQQRFGGEIQGGYYGNRMSFGRPDNYIENYSHNFGQAGSSRRFSQRVNFDPALYGSNNQGLYPAHGHHQSYDTVASTSGNESHGTDQWGNSTDPSSENSSIDRLQQQPAKSEIVDTYGFNGFGGAPQFHGPILEEHGMESPSYGQPGYGQPLNVANRGRSYQGNDIPPAPPPHAPRKDDIVRAPIKLGNAPLTEISPSGANAEKRKSWLRKRFSKG